MGDNAKAEQTRQPALALFTSLPVDREKVEAAIDLSKLLQPVPAFEETVAVTPCFQPESQSLGIELLQQALSMAKQLDDQPSQSLALGQLGRIYECRQDYQQALESTLAARWLAEQDLNSESLYLWEWQTGRIFKETNRTIEAIDLYEREIASLESIRNNILVASRNLQFDFRDTVDPLRDLMEWYPHLNIVVQSSYIKSLRRFKPSIDQHDGGFAIVDKSQSLQEMLKRVDLALQGLTCTPRELRQNVIEVKPEWLELLALAFQEGLQDSEIAKRMNVAERTVGNYWKKIKDVLTVYPDSGENIRIQTEIRAREEGLID